MLRGLSLGTTPHAEDDGMARGGLGDTHWVTGRDLIEMIVTEARRKDHEAGLVVVSGDPDRAPLGGLTWPGRQNVTAQHPALAQCILAHTAPPSRARARQPR
jgi:hypothetical protein